MAVLLYAVGVSEFNVGSLKVVISWLCGQFVLIFR